MGLYPAGIYLGIGLAAVIGGVLIGRLAGAPPLEVPLIGTLTPWHAAFLIVGLLCLAQKNPDRSGNNERPFEGT